MYHIKGARICLNLFTISQHCKLNLFGRVLTVFRQNKQIHLHHFLFLWSQSFSVIPARWEELCLLGILSFTTASSSLSSYIPFSVHIHISPCFLPLPSPFLSICFSPSASPCLALCLLLCSLRSQSIILTCLTGRCRKSRKNERVEVTKTNKWGEQNWCHCASQLITLFLRLNLAWMCPEWPTRGFSRSS